jgi:hypothetical protein
MGFDYSVLISQTTPSFVKKEATDSLKKSGLSFKELSQKEYQLDKASKTIYLLCDIHRLDQVFTKPIR